MNQTNQLIEHFLFLNMLFLLMDQPVGYLLDPYLDRIHITGSFKKMTGKKRDRKNLTVKVITQ